ncbi:MAG: hypothetical protein Q8K51_15095 [Nitrospirota bacterium]|nr:hypothetical protein [Nitrospirota bacterium]
MVETESTRFDNTLKRIKNHKFLSIVLLLGVIIVAVGSFTDALTKIIALITTEPTQLEVTDIIVSPGETGTRKLDIRVVNNSKRTINVSRLRLKALSFEDKTAGQARPKIHSPISAEYNVNLGELKKTGQAVEIPVAHDLESGKSDRFVVVVGMKNLKRLDQYAWSLDIELVTNVGIASGPKVSLELP